jgi:hypothetical protein
VSELRDAADFARRAVDRLDEMRAELSDMQLAAGRFDGALAREFQAAKDALGEAADAIESFLP